MRATHTHDEVRLREEIGLLDLLDEGKGVKLSYEG